MAVITAEIIASVQSMIAEGKKPGTIAMMLKIKKADVEGIVAGTITEAGAVQPEILVEGTAGTEGGDAALPLVEGTNNELAKMVLQQQAQAAEAAAAKPERKARSKKAPVDKTKRDLVKIFSAQEKTVFLTTNIIYSYKTVQQLVDLAKKDLKNKKKLVAMLGAADLTAEIVSQHEATDTVLDLAKATLHMEMDAAGWVMGSTCPKVAGLTDKKKAKVEEAPVVAETPEAPVQEAEVVAEVETPVVEQTEVEEATA